MANKVYLHTNGVIVIEVIGDQDVASVSQMGEQTRELIKQQRAAGMPCLVLDDLLAMGKVGGDARDQVVKLAKELDYDKAAMVGHGGLMRMGTNLMLRATGRGDKARFFEDKDKALTWLRAYPTQP
jgi:UDP-N-acetylmuramyl pentapeptide synthase